MSKNSVMVFVEQTAGQIAEVSVELVCKARELADQLRVDVSAVVLGHDMQDKLAVLGHYGCDCVYYVEEPRVAHFTSLPYATAITTIIKKHQPQIVLFGATVNGRDLAPRVSAELRCGLTADCTDLQIGKYEFKNQVWENTLLQIRPAFGGNIIATIVSPESSPSMATVREGVMKMVQPDTSRRVKIINEAVDFAADIFCSEVLEVMREAREVNLKAAKIIVAVGMGVATRESLDLVMELARVLGAEVGCTRPVVDAGLLGWERQIGQTGTTVRPNLYIACGISGQLQHTSGMNESRRIIAINKDAHASIFKLAHYGIVADLNSVIPKMIKAYKNKL